MRAARFRPVPGPRRRVSAVALGAVAIAVLAPATSAAALSEALGRDGVTDAPAAGTTSPAPDEAEPTPVEVVLPAVEQQDQVPAPVEPATVATPADATTDAAPGPTAAPAPEPAPATDPAPVATTADPVSTPAAPAAEQDLTPGAQAPAAEVTAAAIVGAYGTGKTVNPQVYAADGNLAGRDLAGAVFEIQASGPAGTRVETRTTGFGGWAPSFTAMSDESMTVTLASAPDGFMTMAVSSRTYSPCDPLYSYCGSETLNLPVLADYRRVALDVSSSLGGALAGATFDLLGPADSSGNRTLVGSGTSDATGRVAISGTVTPGSDYLVVQTGVPATHLAAADRPLTIGDVATQAQADVPMLVPVVVPALPAPSISTPTPPAVVAGQAVFLDVLATVDGHGAAVTLTGVSTSGPGTVSIGTDPACTATCPTGVLYRAAAGFAGTETVTYEVTSVGGVSYGTVAMSVAAPVVVTPPSTPPVVTPPVVTPAAGGAAPVGAAAPAAARPAVRAALAQTGTEPLPLGAFAAALVGLGLLTRVGAARVARRQV